MKRGRKVGKLRNRRKPRVSIRPLPAADLTPNPLHPPPAPPPQLAFTVVHDVGGVLRSRSDDAANGTLAGVRSNGRGVADLVEGSGRV